MKLNDLKIIAKKRSKEKNFMKNLLVNPFVDKKIYERTCLAILLL